MALLNCVVLYLGFDGAAMFGNRLDQQAVAMLKDKITLLRLNV